jgi:hypothetical protein
MPIPYEVVSTSEADDDLTELWRKATSRERQAITRAAAYIDKYLSFDAHLKGFPYSRKFPQRRLFVKSPPVVYFAVSAGPSHRGKVLITAFREARSN